MRRKVFKTWYAFKYLHLPLATKSFIYPKVTGRKMYPNIDIDPFEMLYIFTL